MAAPNPPVRVTVLISGSGSNLQALIDASRTPALPNISIVRVISDRKNAYGLTRAHTADIPTAHLGILPYKKLHPDPSPSSQFLAARAAYDADLAALVLADDPQLVICAGFMRIVTPAFLDPLAARRVRIINLHPSLHGDLVGAHCIERAWAEFERGERSKTGIMIHYVIAEVDMGAPVEQQEVGMEGCKSLEELEGSVHEAEHGLIVRAARKVVGELMAER